MSILGFFGSRIFGVAQTKQLYDSLKPPPPPEGALPWYREAWAACNVLGERVPGLNRRVLDVHLGAVLIALVTISIPAGIFGRGCFRIYQKVKVMKAQEALRLAAPPAATQPVPQVPAPPAPAPPKN